MLTCSSARRGGGWHSGVLTCEVITQAWRRNYLKRYSGGGDCKGKEVKKMNEKEPEEETHPHLSAAAQAARQVQSHVCKELCP